MVITFADFNLSDKILDALADLNLFEPTLIQQKTFSPILSGRDVMGIAQTGTGKTLAYLLPVLKNWSYSKSGNPTVLILVPTRELVVQITEILDRLTQNLSTRVIGVYGGKNINTQKLLFNDGCDILVGTPGRVMDLAIDNAISLKEIKKLIIDEFDEMLNLGFRPQLTHIFEMMRARRQNILFSATMTEAVDEMLHEYFASPVEISLAKSGTPIEKIEQTGIKVENFNTKINLLEYLLSTNPEMSKVLIFNNNKKNADYLFTKLSERFPNTFDVIHSNKSQNYRLRAMKKFEDAINLTKENLFGNKNSFEKIKEFDEKFVLAMDEDMNTPQALATIFEQIKYTNKLLTKFEDRKDVICEIKSSYESLKNKIENVLGIKLESEKKFEKSSELTDKLIDLLLEVRKDARIEKNFKLSDKIRDSLKNLGIEIKDAKDGSTSYNFKE